MSALERVRFHELVRRTPVHLVYPRALDRAARVCHAFGPIPPAVFSLMGGVERGVLEGPQDPSGGAVAEALAFLRETSRILDGLRIPHAWVQSDLFEHSLGTATFTIVACPGAARKELLARATERILSGAAVSFGPRAPERDELFRPAGGGLPRLEHPRAPLILSGTGDVLEEALTGAVTALGIAPLEAEPAGIHTTVHEDGAGIPRILFVLNTADAALEAVVRAPRARHAKDALTGEEVLVTGEHAVLAVEPRSVRMLELLPRLEGTRVP